MKAVTVKLHAPSIEPRFRHQTIFDTFDQLQSGEVLELTNDHEPRPLYYQFMMERQDQFSWDYLEQGPELWKVLIEKK